MRALIIVDVQNDFCEGGSVPTARGAAVASAINEYLSGDRGYHYIVATQDFHIDPGDHFSDHPDYSCSWPVHCVAGSEGANFRPELDIRRVDAVFRKGAHSAAYSGFEGVDEKGTTLLGWLRRRGVNEVDVVGIATDFCVRRTAEDAAAAGLATRVLVDLTAAAAVDSAAEALTEMRSAGIELVGRP
ncbi:pyrazinamidase PncA [Mycobacterium sp. E2479]|uniref:pyrazinamidase PncA n=1 Tax=Mycobacterium sp. E2479 TaxID=1834134 RepID=UPI0009EF263E|nr:pyrazinamidase PncA [Mycobacterium sp. E2479]